MTKAGTPFARGTSANGAVGAADVASDPVRVRGDIDVGQDSQCCCFGARRPREVPGVGPEMVNLTTTPAAVAMWAATVVHQRYVSWRNSFSSSSSV
jgi:hypothetical protein